MADAFDQFEMLLREFISPAVVNLVLEDDDPSWALIDTFKPETVGGRDPSTSTPSAGYFAEWKVKVQEGGRVTGGQFTGNTQTVSGVADHLFVGQSADALYPDPTLTPQPSWISIKMALKRIQGSVTVNRQQVLADLATRPIDQIAGNAIMDATSRLRGYITNYFWGDGNAGIATVNNASGYTISEDSQTAVEIDGLGTFAKFKKGDVIQAFASGYGTLRTGAGAGTDNIMHVVGIDRDNRNIELESATGEGDFSLSDDDELTIAGAITGAGGTHLVPNGVEALLRNSGNFPGTSLDVADYHELKSFISGNEASKDDPTPEAIALVLDKIADAGYAPPEALFAERSLWTLYGQLEREAGAQYVVPQGAAFISGGGIDGPVVQHMGNRFQRFSSVRMRPGSMTGIAPSTWKKYVPLGNKTIQWAYSNGPLSGTQSIFGPVHGSGRLSELAEAPYDSFIEFSCDKPGRNFRRIGFKTQRDV